MVNEIPISVVDRKIKVGRHVPATMTNIGKDYLSISLDNEWSNTNHRLRVTLYSEAPYVSVQDWWDGKSAIEIPQEITSCPAFKVTVALISEDGYERLVTQSMDEPIENPRNGHDEGSEPGVRTMDIIARIDNLAADLEEKRDTDYWRGQPGKDADIAGAEAAKNAANSAAEAAINAAESANSATSEAHNAANVATEAVMNADTATANANAAAVNAESKAAIATAAAENASEKASIATSKAGEAESAANVANEAATIANNAATNANESATNADTAATNANAAATEAHGAAANANEAAANANNAADRISAYTEIIKQNKKRITSLEGIVSKQGKQIANLQGIAATEETDSTEAYTKTVPTGAQKWASLDKVGGKTVVWNQHFDYIQTTGGTATETDEYVELNAVNAGNRIMLKYDSIGYPVVSEGHKYLFMGMFSNVSNSSASIVQAYYGFGNPYTITNKVYHTGSGWGIVGAIVNIGQTGQGLFQFAIINTELPTSYRYKKNSGVIIDLTAMFGTGNEPATVEQFRAMFPADYYPYNPGELMSAEVVEVESKGTFLIPAEVREMCPGYGWSAGTACNEIDFERKVYVKRVGSVDLGTLDWVRFSNGRMQAYTSYHTHANGLYDLVTNCVCSKYVATSAKIIESSQPVDKTVALGGNSNTYDVYDSDYTDADIFKAAMSGVMLYYELEKPVEVDLSDVLTDDHYIEVEAGGTVTFKQASTQLPVPSSVTYQISTKEAIANA